MLPSKVRVPHLDEREKAIQDDTIKRYILNILVNDPDANEIEKKAVLEILQNLDKRSKQAQ